MGLLDVFRRGLAPMPASDREIRNRTIVLAAEERRTQARSIDTSIPWETQLLAAQGLTSRPWRYPSVREALGVPAVFRSVSLIANTTGSLPIEAYRKGTLLAYEATPRVVTRPDPFRTPRAFYRDSAYYLATRGECWYWVAKRDLDGSALSLIVVPPWEVTVTVEGADRLRPTIRWRGVEMAREDMRQITFLPDETGLRGVGPMQLCGAALSVAVESQEWAANFFVEDGGYPSILIKAAGALDLDPDTGEHEADAFLRQWQSKPHNTPRVVDESVESVDEFGANAQGAQMLQAREYQNGDAARMFGIPGSLLEFSTPGSSLSYQNLETEYVKFVRTCLAPNYLEPIEQELSDLLTRSTVARFNVRGLLRADVKTRYEVHKIAIETGIYPPEFAAQQEGYAPGDVEFAPIPPAVPQAIPDAMPVAATGGPVVPYLEERSPENGAPVSISEPILPRVERETTYWTHGAPERPGTFRCEGTRVQAGGILRTCGKLLADDWRGKCPRCKREYPLVA